MSENNVPEPDEVSGELRLIPQPTLWKIGRRVINGPQGPVQVMDLVINQPNSIQGSVWGREDALALAEAITQEWGGLHVAAELPRT